MRCERVDQLLPPYLDGDLSGRLSRQVSDHLDDCERCRRRLAAQQRAHRALDAGCRPIRIDLWADFSRRLQVESPPPPSPWRALWQPGLAAAIAAAAVALIAFSARPVTPTATLGESNSQFRIAHQPIRESELGRSRISSAAHPFSLSQKGMVVADLRLQGQTSLASARPSLSQPGSHHRGHRRSRRFSGHRPSAIERSAPSLAAARSTILALAPDREETRFESSHAEIAPAATPGPGVRESRSEVNLAVDRSDPTSSPVSHTSGRRGPSGNPFMVAEALASAEQDAASEQVGGELLRLAREVARVGGEPAPGSPAVADENNHPSRATQGPSTNTGT